MSGQVQGVFSTKDPEAIANWQDYLDARAAYMEDVRKIGREFGDRDPMITQGHQGRVSFHGLKPKDYQDGKNPPPGWRLDSKTLMFKPALRTAEGKALKARFNKLAITKALEVKGMPKEVWPSSDGMGESYIYWPGYILDGDTLWCYWGCTTEYLIDPRLARKNTIGAFDSTVWKVEKLSAWHQMKERRAEAQEKEKIDG